MKNSTETYEGYLSGVLRWEDWDRLRHHVTGSGEPWYVYAVGHGIPDQPVSGEPLAMLLAELDALLRRDHDEPYFGIAYADDLTEPTLVKIYDPHNLGSSCGSSGRAIPPGWILCRMRPEPVASDLPLPNSRKRWRNLVGRFISPSAEEEA
jgi:hypothetical protein